MLSERHNHYSNERQRPLDLSSVQQRLNEIYVSDEDMLNIARGVIAHIFADIPSLNHSEATQIAEIAEYISAKNDREKPCTVPAILDGSPSTADSLDIPSHLSNRVPIASMNDIESLPSLPIRAVLPMEPKANNILDRTALLSSQVEPGNRWINPHTGAGLETFNNLERIQPKHLLVIGHGTTHDRLPDHLLNPISKKTGVIGRETIIASIETLERKSNPLRGQYGIQMSIDTEKITPDQARALHLLGNNWDDTTGRLRLTDAEFSRGLTKKAMQLRQVYFATCYSKELTERTVHEHPQMNFGLGYDGALPIWLAEITYPAFYTMLSAINIPPQNLYYHNDTKAESEYHSAAQRGSYLTRKHLIAVFETTIQALYEKITAHLKAGLGDDRAAEEKAKLVTTFYLQQFVLVMKVRQ